MTVGYSGWRAGALAVAGCALGVLLAGAPAPAQAQCVGDCNQDGVVMINELITGVNIALGSADVTDCPSFDINEDGMVAINELITAVNNAQNGCPVVDTPTATVPIDTPTATFTIPAGTATATVTPVDTETPVADTPTPTITPVDTETPVGDTPTPTATESPTEAPLGTQICTLFSPDDRTGSVLALQTASLPLNLVPKGTASIDCGVPGADGVATCSCEVVALDPLTILSIGDVCVSPAEGCAPGKIDCDGGSPLDVDLNADHNIGSCTTNAECATACDAHCAGLGEHYARQLYGCEGYCQGGENDEMECGADSDCPGGQCPGRDPVNHFDTCGCVCAGDNLGDPSVSGGLFCNLGLQINVELPATTVCGDTPPTIQLAPVCGGITSETSVGVVTDANNAEGETIPTGGPSVVEGAAITCDDFKMGNLTGLKMQGQLGFFDSTLGDIRSGNTFVCQ